MSIANIIGIGPGNNLTLTKEAENAIRRSSCLIGDQRVIASFQNLGKPAFYSSNVQEITDYLKKCGPDGEVSILVSGDVGFYSLAKGLLEQGEKLGEKLGKIRLICGISSMQYFCSKLKLSWEDVETVSLHGRNANLIAKVMQNRKVFVLTGGNRTPSEICRMLCEYGLESLQVSVGENLSYENERITTAPAEKIAQGVFAKLNVLMIVNNKPFTRPCVTPGLPDEFFIRGDVPMTKQEVRAVTISKLQLCPADIAYDIGAGTGSVAVEMAMQLEEGFVYAVEKDPEGLELIRKNKEKLGVINLGVIAATAPGGLEELPKPDKVLIGGSGGNLEGILDTVFCKNPNVRVVINAITLETLNNTISYFKDKPDYNVEIVNIAVSKSRKIREYHLMTGQNPVYIITAQRKYSNELE